MIDPNERQKSMTDNSTTVDFLIVGSGGGALVGALQARKMGLMPLIIEKTDLVGGSTAMSGGVVWSPANNYLLGEGVEDSLEEGLTYLEAVVGDAGPATSRTRKEAFLRGCHEMIALLEEEGLQLKYTFTPDDYTDVPGGKKSGRAIEAKITRQSVLGGWSQWLRKGPAFPLTLYMDDAKHAQLAFRHPRHFLAMLRIIARTVRGRLQGEQLLTLGHALVAQMLVAIQRQGISIWRNTPMHELIVEEGQVVGVLAQREGHPIEIRSRHGVLLAAGGFAHNRELRTAHSAPPIDGELSSASPGDTGDALQAALALGAASSNLDEAIWLPVPVIGGVPALVMWERSMPHSIIVDSSGERYMNESAPYMEAGQKMLARNRDVRAVPSWLIIDSTHRRRYPFLTSPPGITPKAWLESGFMHKADTIERLAATCGIDPVSLSRTIERFNQMASVGRDEDFHRGETAYDRHFGDASNKPNPNLGAIEKGPFYAVEQYVTDVGTVGGLVTDEHARVLRDDGTTIPGLYASGCSAASVHGRIYPAPGASISNSMTFGYLAAKHAAHEAHVAETQAVNGVKGEAWTSSMSS
jgi:3-oxosteroid 1-dehydrogenase